MSVLRVAVVGHTNTGKTSLMRTLTRDVSFGEVSDRPATTRHVEGAAVMADGRVVMELYDTPGLEDSTGLLEMLEEKGERRSEGHAAVTAFLESPEASGRFAQEAKALRQVLAGELVLYVVDVRDRVLGKHRDELEILARCAVPVVPVLNFTADQSAQVAPWRAHLAKVNMHAVAEFDTVVVDEVAEERLYDKMRSLADAHDATFRALIADRRRQRSMVVTSSSTLIADLLLDVAAQVVAVPRAAPGDPAASVGAGEQALERLRDRIRTRERVCIDSLLQLHRFRLEDAEQTDLASIDGRLGLDPFAPESLKRFGISTGGGAAAGAMVGLMLDAMVGGISLGAATAAGAAIGGLLGGRAYGRQLVRQAQGTGELRPDDATIRILAFRQIALVRALLKRGHAAVTPVTTTVAKSSRRDGSRMPAAIQQARLHAEWSSLNDERRGGSGYAEAGRQGAQDVLAARITELIKNSSGSDVRFP